MEYLGDGKLYQGKLKELPFKDVLPGSVDALQTEGFVIFSLGPVYVYAGVQHDILEKFAGDECTERALNGRQPCGGTIHFEHDVLVRCEKWNRALNVMDLESYGFFTSWMLSQTFINRPEKRYYVPRRMTAPVLDPLAILAGGHKPVSLDIFTISGIYAVIRPKGFLASRVDTKHFIDFERCAPEPHVVKEGKLLLQMTESK